ncbi:MAG: sigma 54-interacting transcriptional regulator [bacterium]
MTDTKRKSNGWFQRSVAIAVPLGALLVALAFITLSHIYVLHWPDFGVDMNEDLRVTSVDPGRAATGKVRKGDLLLAVVPENQEPIQLRSGFHALKVIRKIGVGRPARFVFSRSGRRYEVTLSARWAALWPGLGLSLGSFLVVLILCIVLWAARRGETGLNWYIVVILNTYIVLYGFTHMKGMLSSAPLFLTYLFFDLFTLPLLLHLFLRFPEPLPIIQRFRLIPLALYIPQVTVTLLTAAGYLLLYANPSQLAQERMLLLSKWAIPVIFLLYLLASLVVLLIRFLTSPSAMRKQIQWIMYGAVLAGILTAGFSFSRWHTNSTGWLLESSEYLLPIYAIMALCIAFSFMEFRLIDVDRIVHRSLVYAVLSGVVVVVYFVLAGGLGLFLTKIFYITSSTVTVLATIVSVGLFFPLRRAVQSNVDRLFFRHHTVYQEILQQASSEFVTMLDLNRLSKMLLDMLTTKLSRRHAMLLLAGEDRRLEVIHATGRPLELGPGLPTVDSFVLRKLRAHSSGETVAVARLLADVQPARLAQEFAAIFDALDSSLVVFLVSRDRILGLLVLGAKVDDSMVSRDEIVTLEALGRQLSVVIRNASAYTEIEQLSRDLSRRQQEILELKNRLEAENIYLRTEIQQAARHGDIVGDSESMKQVLEKSARVARSDATVLILGESGTGKELIARAIHEGSDRREQALVTINCAAIPEGLLESELFGHVKGAFTGAVARKRGRFELADGGTLFFDEVGDMPLSLQAKLLRALQEGEVIPVGGEVARRVDVRVIAATHRNLEQRVVEGLFREDLFYRLNVVPVQLPPLRDRPEDIPLLAEYFASLFAGRTGKEITGISKRAMDRLLAYSWPGNVRELGNVIERAVVLSNGRILDEEVTLPADRAPSRAGAPAAAWEQTAELEALPEFQDAVTDFKRRFLTEAVERAGGNRAAAARQLGLQRTYLYRLIKQLEV